MIAERRGKDILIILSLFSVAFLIRAAGVPTACMYPDEYGYHFLGSTVLANNFTPVAEVFKYVNPLFSYIEAVVSLLFDGNLETIRMISVFFGSLTVPFLYLFGREVYDKKTGLLAASFLCFSSYHCLFSRLIMFEALTLFFITAFVYFFWRSQSEEKIKSACLAGIMLGLAIDAKYISFILAPAALAYVFWTKRFSFKALLDKRLIITFLFALLFFAPLLICFQITGVGLGPIYYHAVKRFEKGAQAGGRLPSATRVHEIPLNELIEKAGIKIPEILAWGNQSLNPFWRSLFLLSALLLFIITLLYFFLDFTKREKEGSFLTIFILGFFIFIFLGCSVSKYYLLYTVLFYFVMLSHLAVKSFERLRTRLRTKLRTKLRTRGGKNYKNIFSFFVILLTTIMLFSSFVTAVSSPYWDKGDYSWTESALNYIKTDVRKSGYEGHIIIGRITQFNIIDYAIHLSDLNATSFLIMTPASEYSGELATVDIEKINILKPHYLIVEELYSFYLEGKTAKPIFDDYTLVFHSQTYPYKCLVFKRRTMQPPELLSSEDGKDGKISQEIFERSVPSVMKVGAVSTALVRVKNTGGSRTNFTVVVYSDQYTIFVDEPWRSLTLNSDSTRMLKFKILPVREHAGKISITVDLYAEYEKGGERVGGERVGEGSRGGEGNRGGEGGEEAWRKVDSFQTECIILKKG